MDLESLLMSTSQESPVSSCEDILSVLKEEDDEIELVEDISNINSGAIGSAFITGPPVHHSHISPYLPTSDIATSCAMSSSSSTTGVCQVSCGAMVTTMTTSNTAVSVGCQSATNSPIFSWTSKQTEAKLTMKDTPLHNRRFREYVISQY